MKENGRVVDLDVVEERAKWKTITRRPDPLEYYILDTKTDIQNTKLPELSYLTFLCFHSMKPTSNDKIKPTIKFINSLNYSQFHIQVK